MNYSLFMAIFFSLGVFYFVLGWIASKKIKTTSDYFLAGRNLGLLQVTFTLLATQIGGGMLLGTSQEAYLTGYYGILYAMGMGLGYLILGLGFASKLRELNISTTVEIFETKYNSPTLKKLASLLSVVTLFGLLVGQIIGSRFLISCLGLDGEFIFLAFWVIIIAYTIMGGLKAVALTDSAQVILILIVFSGIFLYALWGETESFFSISSIIKHQKMFPSSTLTFRNIIGIALMPTLFSLIGQEYAQRFFASKTKKIAALSALLASVLMVSFAIVPVYFGIKAKLLGIAFSGNPLIPVIGQLTNQFVLILAVCGIIAAITSTGDSLLCAISSNIAQDFNFSSWNIKNKLTLSKIITLVTGALAVATSYTVPQNIICVLIASYEISVCCLLVPLLSGYFAKKNLNKNAAIASILFGFIGFILFRLFPIAIPREIASLGLSFVGYLVGSKINLDQPTLKKALQR